MFKHSVITITLTLGTLLAEAQLTVGEVHDFQAGDVFQSRYTSSNAFGTNPSNYVTDTIIAVQWSQDLDTVFYTISRTSHYMGTVQSSIHDIFYTGLTDPATHWGGVQTCTPPDDSVYVSEMYCDRMIWEKFNSASDTCFEAPGYYSLLIAGCGGPYYWTMVSDNAGEGFERELIYYLKGEEECGDFHPIPTFIREMVPSSPSFYPNPTEGIIFFEEGYDAIEVLDARGRRVMHQFDQDRADLTSLESGIYLLRFYLDGRSLPVQRVMKH